MHLVVGDSAHETCHHTTGRDGDIDPCTSAKRNGYTYILTELLPHSIMHSRQIQRPHALSGTLDSMLWDRKALQQILASTISWKCINHSPNAAGATMSRLSLQRSPIGRFDSRLNGHTWTILNWWWRRLSNQMPSCMQPRHGHPQLYALSARPGYPDRRPY